MLSNYFKNALRHFRKHLGYMVLSLAGLVVGLVVTLLVGLWIHHQLSFDAFHEDADRIYRVTSELQTPRGNMSSVALTTPPVAPSLQSKYAGIEAAVRVDFWQAANVEIDGQHFAGDAFFTADRSFFDVFSFRLLKGNAAEVLAAPNSVVLTEATKRKYFGDRSAIGKSIRVDGSTQLTVTGVMETVPDNSHIDFDALVSRTTVSDPSDGDSENWLALDLYTYVKLSPGADASEVGSRIRDLVSSNTPEDLPLPIFLQPLTSIHFETGYGGDLAATQNPRNLYVFGSIALFVLLIACVNYINLATARSMDRSQEIGIRKSLGAERAQLQGQFLTETFVLAALAGLLALVLAVALLEPFNWIAESSFTAADLFQPTLLLGLVGAVVGVGLLAGSYPALLLSGFSPIDTLRGSTDRGADGEGVRYGLVVFQFAISIALIVGSTVVYQQIQYMQSQDLGFNDRDLVVLEASSVPGEQFIENYQALKQEINALASVERAAATMTVPGGSRMSTQSALRQTETGEVERLVEIYAAGTDYLETLQIDLLAGRTFSERTPSDSTQRLVINQKMATELGWSNPADAVGEVITLQEADARVIGVMDNYHHSALSETIEPMAIEYAPSTFGYLVVRLESGRVEQALPSIEEVWSRFFSGWPMQSFFLGDRFARQYQDQHRLQRAFRWGAFLALLIAGLGLFGLSAFMVARRTNEIGIRKALGASKLGILWIFLKKFGLIVGVSFALAVPVALLGAQQWLQNFPYRTSLTATPFVVAAVAALALSAASVGYHVYRAATLDPARSIRQE
jgi:putative ABC transport system permease protein